MADDGTLRIGTQVNIGPLQQGMAQAQATVKQAYNSMGQDAEILARVAATGSMKASEAVERYAKFVKEAQTAVEGLAEAEEKEASVLRGGMSARMAASAELRMLEGNIQGSTRAAGAFLSTLPGVGAAMQMAFPVVGALAVLEILAKAATAAHKLYDEYANLRSIVNQVNKEISEEQGKAIELSNQHIANLREQQVIQAQLVGGKAGRENRGQEAGDRFDAAQTANNLAIARANLTAQTEKLADMERRAKAIQYDPIRGVQATADAKFAGIEVDKIKEQLANANTQVRNYEEQLQTQNDAAKLARIKESEKVGAGDDSAARKAAQDKLRAMETSLEEQKAQAAVGVFAERTYWQQRIGAFQQGSSEYLTVITKIAQLTAQAHREETEVVKQSQERATRDYEQSSHVMESASKAMGKVMLEQAEDVLHSGERWREYNNEVLQAAQIQSAAQFSLEKANLSTAESQGVITKHTAALQTQSIHVRELRDRLNELDAAMKRVNADENLTPAEKATQLQGLQNKKAQAQSTAAVQNVSDQAAVTQSIAQPYLRAFDTINQSWLQVQNKLIFGTRNVGQAFANMGVSLLESVAANFEKMLIKAVESEIQMTIAHQVANEAKVASTSVAAAQTEGISALSAIKQISHSAAVAAAGAYSAMAGIPFIGPVLGAVAAAGTFAAVEALAAFETGGIIPNTGVALVHQGEAVLPRNLTNMLMNTANNDNRTSSSASMVNHFHGNTDRQFKDQLTRHSGHVLAAVHRGLRNKGRA